MKELEDYSEFPSLFRDFQTEFIGFIVTRFKVYDAFIAYLKTLTSSVQMMYDLCSGSGEPAISIFKRSGSFSVLSLSDKYPAEIKDRFENSPFIIEKKDVLDMEFKGGNCYTMFNAFHHFSDKDKARIVNKIQTAGSNAFIVEILEPNIICFIKILLTTTVGVLLLTPFIRPFSIGRLFFTYILPINILTIAFDGIVSVFKSRTTTQYQNLFARADDAIKIFRFKSGLNALVVIQIEKAN